VLKEIRNIRQDDDHGLRRWFSDEEQDLIVWESEQRAIQGFQLCYGVGSDEHALTWRVTSGYTHHKVDDGEEPGTVRKSTPILVPDGHFDPKHLADAFLRRSKEMDFDISQWVYNKLLSYP
jgi:hypothetical protein